MFRNTSGQEETAPDQLVLATFKLGSCQPAFICKVCVSMCMFQPPNYSHEMKP